VRQCMPSLFYSSDYLSLSHFFVLYLALFRPFRLPIAYLCRSGPLNHHPLRQDAFMGTQLQGLSAFIIYGDTPLKHFVHGRPKARQRPTNGVFPKNAVGSLAWAYLRFNQGTDLSLKRQIFKRDQAGLSSRILPPRNFPLFCTTYLESPFVLLMATFLLVVAVTHGFSANPKAVPRYPESRGALTPRPSGFFVKIPCP